MKDEVELTVLASSRYDKNTTIMAEDKEGQNPQEAEGKRESNRKKTPEKKVVEKDARREQSEEEAKEKKESPKTRGKEAENFFETLQQLFTNAEQATGEKEVVDARTVLQFLNPDKEIKEWNVVDYAAVLGTLNDIDFEKGAARLMRKELFTLAKEQHKDVEMIETFAAGNEPGGIDEELPATQRVYAHIQEQLETLAPDQLEVLRQQWTKHENPAVAAKVLTMIAQVKEHHLSYETPPMQEKTLDAAIRTLFSSDVISEASSSGDHNVLGGLLELAAGQAASRWTDVHYRKLVSCFPTSGLNDKDLALVTHLREELNKFATETGIISSEDAAVQESKVTTKEGQDAAQEPFALFAQNMEVTLDRLGPNALAHWQKDWENFQKHAEQQGDTNAAQAIAIVVERIKQEKERKQQLVEQMQQPVEVKKEENPAETKNVVAERREQQEKMTGQIKLLEMKIKDVTNPELKEHLEELLQKLKNQNHPFSRWSVSEMQSEYTALLARIASLSHEIRTSDNPENTLQQFRDLRRDTVGYQDLLVRRLQKHMSAEEWAEFSKQAAEAGKYATPEQEAAANRYVALQRPPDVDPLAGVNVGVLAPEFQRIASLAQDASAARNMYQLDDVRKSFSQLMLQPGAQFGQAERDLMNAVYTRLNTFQRMAEGEGRMLPYTFELEDPPYSPEDSPLYKGDIDDVIKERFRRIMYGRGGGIPTNPEELQEYQRVIALNITDEQRREYYEDIQQWVKVVLRNDDIETRGGKLHLLDARRQAFKAIVGRDAATASMADILREIGYLRDENNGRLTRYFLHHDDPHTGRGEFHGLRFIDKNVRREKLSRGGLPESLEDTMVLIEDQYGAEYPEIRTGGEYELIDKYGNFHYENFIYWTRQRVNWMKEENPTSEINPLGQINLRTGITQLNLMEILYTPQYLQYGPIEIKGNETRDPDFIESGEAANKIDHPDMVGRSVSSKLLYELAWLGREHNQSAAYYQIRGDKKSWQEQVRKGNIDNYLTRGNHILDYHFKLPSHRKGRSEYDSYYREGEEGSVGKAIRGTIGANFLFTEFTTYYKDNETGRVKNFNENGFYRYLGPNGSASFLLGMAEKSLGTNGAAQQKYKEFVSARIEAAAQEFRSSNPRLTSDKQRELDLLTENYIHLLKDPSTSINVGFENAVGTIVIASGRQQNVEFLVDFRSQIESRVLGRKPDKETIRKTVREHDLLPHIKSGFFDNLYGLQFHSDRNKNIELQNELRSVLSVFTPEQITFFDYADPGHPGNPGFDPNNPERDADFRQHFANTEKMALTLAKVLHKLGRRDYVHGKLGARPEGDINYFSATKYSQVAESIVDHAFQKSLKKIFDLSGVDANYAYLWGKTFLWTTGVAALNDTEAIGFDFWTKLIRFKEWNLRQKEDRSLGTNNLVADEIRALSMTWWETMRLSEAGSSKATIPLINIILGGDGDNIKPMGECTLAGGLNFPANAQSDFANNHVGAAVPTFENLITKEFMLKDAIYTDINGNLVFDWAKAHEAYNTWWRNYKYTKAQDNQDPNDITRRNGRAITQWDNWLGPRAAEIDKVIKAEYGKSDHAKAGFAAILGAELRAHHNAHGQNQQWTIGIIKNIEGFFAHSIGRGGLEEKGMYGEGQYYKVKKGFFTPKVFNAILRAYGTSYRKMYWTEFNGQVLGGLLSGFAAAFKEITKHLIPKE